MDKSILIFSDCGRWSKSNSVEEALTNLVEASRNMKRLRAYFFNCDEDLIIVSDSGGFTFPEKIQMVDTGEIKLNDSNLSELKKLDDLIEAVAIKHMEINSELELLFPEPKED